MEEKWLFKSGLVCYREEGGVPKMWTECSESNDDRVMISMPMIQAR